MGNNISQYIQFRRSKLQIQEQKAESRGKMLCVWCRVFWIKSQFSAFQKFCQKFLKAEKLEIEFIAERNMYLEQKKLADTQVCLYFTVVESH